MRSIAAVAVVMFVSLAGAATAFADVQVSIREDGRISISARGATVTEILAEWAKVGQTTIVNGEKIPHDPLTLELENVSEDEALEVVLRTASGYLAAPRAVSVPNASRFDRIVVMPPSVVALPPPSAAPFAARLGAPPPPVYPSATAVYQAPAYPSSEPQQPPAPVVAASEPAYDPATDTSASDEQPIVMMIGGNPTMTPSARTQQIANTTRQALETVDPREFKLPPQPPAGVVAPAGATGPRGVAVPGMIVQPPAQPRQPGQPPGARE